jgi:hypothetical protein
MTTRFGVRCSRIWCLSSPTVTLTPSIWCRLDSNFWCRHLIWRIWCRTQIFGVGTFFLQQRKTDECGGCTCGNRIQCFVACSHHNAVMDDAGPSVACLQPARRRCSVLCQREDCARTGRDRRPWPMYSPQQASRWLRPLAGRATTRRPAVGRLSLLRKTSPFSRAMFVLRTIR